jgi:uncharacterized RDD family membrane protein YckC
MALVRSGDDKRPVLLVLGGNKPGRGGSILHESTFDGSAWSAFSAVPGTEAGPGFGYIYFSAAETPGGLVCVRSNTQKLQVLYRRGGTWVIVESPEGLREGNMQLYAWGLLLLAAAMLGAGLLGLARRLAGRVPPEPPPGWRAVAPMSRRGLAYVIDLFFVGSAVLMGLVAFEIDLLAVATSIEIQAALYTIPLAYFVVAETVFGATLGKRLMGVIVVMTDGSPLTPVAAVVRNALRVFDGLPMAAAIPVFGFVVASFTRRQQRIGDMFARTVVVGLERTNEGSKRG